MPNNEGVPGSGVSNCYVFKSRLQELAQKKGLPTPVYETIKEGPSHEPLFKSTVTFNGIRYDSLPGHFNRKAAEQSAAEIALLELEKLGEIADSLSQPVYETGLCKNLVQEYAQKQNYAVPLYECRREEMGGATVFTCTVEIGGTRYIGGAARNKKEAEIKAARTALLAIRASSLDLLSGQVGNNSELVVVPCKRRATESVNDSGEAANVQKAKKSKKSRSKKKATEGRVLGQQVNNAQVNYSGNMVNDFFSPGVAPSAHSQTNVSGVELTRGQLSESGAGTIFRDERSDFNINLGPAGAPDFQLVGSRMSDLEPSNVTLGQGSEFSSKLDQTYDSRAQVMGSRLSNSDPVLISQEERTSAAQHKVEVSAREGASASFVYCSHQIGQPVITNASHYVLPNSAVERQPASSIMGEGNHVFGVSEMAPLNNDKGIQVDVSNKMDGREKEGASASHGDGCHQIGLPVVTNVRHCIQATSVVERQPASSTIMGAGNHVFGVNEVPPLNNDKGLQVDLSNEMSGREKEGASASGDDGHHQMGIPVVTNASHCIRATCVVERQPASSMGESNVVSGVGETPSSNNDKGTQVDVSNVMDGQEKEGASATCDDGSHQTEQPVVANGSQFVQATSVGERQSDSSVGEVHNVFGAGEVPSSDNDPVTQVDTSNAMGGLEKRAESIQAGAE